jgi:aminoglycoside phosphotransferase (APT) family kinase protein
VAYAKGQSRQGSLVLAPQRVDGRFAEQRIVGVWMSPRLLGDVVACGSRSTVYAYGRGTVVKVPNPTTPASWIWAEAEYVDAVRAVGAPAPALLGVEEIFGRPASVWERVDGPSLWEEVVERPHRSVEVGRRLAELQLALFELVPPVTLPDQRDRLISKIRWSAANVDASLARALDLLDVRTGKPHLCHGDLHPSNVIVSKHGPVLVDWFDASRGDRVSDVARSLLTLLAEGGASPSHLPGSDPPTLAALTRAYLYRLRESLAVSPDLLSRWQAINAAARLAEGVPRDPLLEVWRRFAWVHGSAADAQAATG